MPEGARMARQTQRRVIELAPLDGSRDISFETKNLSDQIKEALAWISDHYHVPQPKTQVADGQLSARGIWLDRIFILAAAEKGGQKEPVILLSRKPRSQIVFVLFHEFWHYREYLRTGILPNFIALNFPDEAKADRSARLDLRAYSMRP